MGALSHRHANSRNPMTQWKSRQSRGTDNVDCHPETVEPLERVAENLTALVDEFAWTTRSGRRPGADRGPSALVSKGKSNRAGLALASRINSVSCALSWVRCKTGAAARSTADVCTLETLHRSMHANTAPDRCARAEVGLRCLNQQHLILVLRNRLLNLEQRHLPAPRRPAPTPRGNRAFVHQQRSYVCALL